MRLPFVAALVGVLIACNLGVAEAKTSHLNVPTLAATAAVPSDAGRTETALASPQNKHTVTAALFLKRTSIARLAHRILARTNTIASGLTRSALRFIGTPYVFGGTSAGGFDCSGYVQHVFAMMGYQIPRTADAQYYAGGRTSGGLRAGDLVFFQTYEPGPSHVGIYLGNGRFVHASSSHGVMVSSLGDSYWGPRYIGARRLAMR